ncbi:molecular chaperone [Pseudoalteromonas holothuriae]|nr:MULTISPECIES: fimbria/pilus periplasmic chaperone [unclassified Pseudoalteromonas]
MHTPYLFIFLSFFLTVASSFSASANLLISPTRIVFDERTRTAKVYVINNSSERKMYRLQWQEKKAKSEGGYESLPDLTSTSLSPMMRMSPSQISLAPGERQVVKLALRKPRDLAELEYRSHLRFKALPNEKNYSEKQLGITLNMVMSYSIPVIYRANKSIPKVRIADVRVVQPDMLELKMLRTGKQSTFGLLEVLFTPENSQKQQRVAVLSNFSIYPELAEAKVHLSTIDGFRFTQAGELKVRYVGGKEYVGHVFAQHSITLKHQ